MKSIEKAAYGRGHVASGSAQGLLRKKPEQFQYIPPRAPRKEAAQENATKGATSTVWTAEEWAMIQKAQATLEERRRQLEAEEAKGAIR